MLVIIFLITVIFICSAFFASFQQFSISNSFVGYAFFQGHFVISHLMFFLIGFIVLTLLFSRFNFDRSYSLKKLLFFSSLQTITIGVIGFFFAYGLLFVIAWMQLTITSLMVNISPKTLGIISDTPSIIQSLKTNKLPPYIIATDKEENKVLVSLVRATSGVGNFYGTTMITSIPDFLVVPLHDIPSGMILIDHTLIVTQIKANEIQAVSPYIGYALIKAYFPYRKIISYPVVRFMDANEYQAFRVDDAKKKIVKIDLQLEKIDGFISSYSAALTTEKNNTKSKSLKKLLAGYQSYKDFFTSQKEQLHNSTQHLPNELGVFKEPKTINIIYNSNNPHAIADYFATLVHEYLHYASFASDDKRFASAFFEEGVTEYFARKVIENSLPTKTNLGYPVEVKIISAMTNMITESEVAEIYFQKDEDALERAMDRVYGDGFYAKNEVVFESMLYTTNKTDLIALANAIMAQINGEEVTEKDLISSYSKL